MATKSEKMDRGTDILKSTLDGVERMEVHHARRGWLQECLCCITKSDFKYYVGKKKVAVSKEEFTYCCRCCCGPIHSFDMTIKAPGSESELIEFNRPFKAPPATCKCCCKQEATIFSGEDDLGEIRETWWWFVPQFKIYDHDDETVYIVHPPTCCNGVCMDCFTEGNPCPFGCLKIPLRIYPADAEETNGDAPYVGKMLKIPKEKCCDVFHETSYVEIQFPEDSTTNQKGLLLGSFLLLNALFFEGSE